MLPDWLASQAAHNPHRTALVCGGQEWTFRSLNDEASRLAGRLSSFGVVEGDRVCTLLHNGFTAAVIPHSLLRLGATLVPLNIRLSAAELEWQVSDVSPRLVVADSRTIESVSALHTTVLDEAALPSSRETEVALRDRHAADSVLAIIYTSGTTGKPKGAMLTVSNFWWSAIGSALNLGLNAGDRWLACMPLFHIGGLSIIMRSAIYGIAAEVHDGFDAPAVNRAIDAGKVTILSVVAVMLERLLDERSEKPFPPTLRTILLGGGPASPELLERCAAISAPVVQTYGLTETCSQIATLSPEDAGRRIGSSGKALYPNEVRISGESGEILVRGPVVMAGYFNKPEESARVIDDGWLRTGDAGRLDDDGYLYVLDRRNDLIVTGGENVYPAEVEAALMSHPSVEEAGVIGVPDPTWGQNVVAVVRLRDSDADSASLKAHCSSRLAGYKTPSEFHFVTDPLPRTASGKLRRAELREMLAVRPV